MKKLEEKIRVLLSIFACLFLWGFFYPEFTFFPDLYRVYDDTGREVELEESEDIYGLLLRAKPDEIKYSSKIAEWIEYLFDTIQRQKR